MSRLMSRPLKAPPPFENSLTALYVMNAVSMPSPAPQEPEPWHGFDPTTPLPEEVREVAKQYFELEAWRYLDLAVGVDGRAYRVVSEGEGVQIPLRLPGRLAIAPVVSAWRSYAAEGEGGLITGVALAGYLVGFAAGKLGGRIVLRPRLGLAKTLITPALWTP